MGDNNWYGVEATVDGKRTRVAFQPRAWAVTCVATSERTQAEFGARALAAHDARVVVLPRTDFFGRPERS